MSSSAMTSLFRYVHQRGTGGLHSILIALQILCRLSVTKRNPLGRLVEQAITPKLARHNTQVIYQNSMSGTLLNWTLRGAGVCWLPERLVTAEIDQGRLMLVAGPQWHVDLQIAIFSLPTTRFGLAADIWLHLKNNGQT